MSVLCTRGIFYSWDTDMFVFVYSGLQALYIRVEKEGGGGTRESDWLFSIFVFVRCKLGSLKPTSV